MEIKRDSYLKKLVNRMNNTLIKVITGLRRSGKSFLLFKIFKDYLISHGVSEDHIVEISFDVEETKPLLNHKKLLKYLDSRIKDTNNYYFLFDEIQNLKHFEPILLQYMRKPNVDIYVTGSNSRFLSVDIDTALNGKNDPIHIYPLSFSEVLQVYKDEQEAWNNYWLYGGLPMVVLSENISDKINYLKRTFNELYLKDIIKRHRVVHSEEMNYLTNVLASSLGSFTNIQKILNTIKSKKNKTIKWETLNKYINHLTQAFLINNAIRYDIKGKKYIGVDKKYYFEDIGIRNAILGFRQNDIGHIIENVIFNELKIRGFSVDVGSIQTKSIKKSKNDYEKINLEIDFIANFGPTTFYFQVTSSLSEEQVVKRENRPFGKIKDSYPKFILTLDNVPTYRQPDGTIVMNILDFLLNKNLTQDIMNTMKQW